MPTAESRFTTLQQMQDVELPAGGPLVYDPADGVTIAVPDSHVNVAAEATAGAGTAISPWTGWDSAITWASNRRYFFPAGHYSIGSTVTLQSLNGVVLEGVKEATFIHWTGGASTMLFVDESAGTNGTEHNLISGFVFDGGQAATLGIRARSFHDSEIRDCRFYDFASSGTTALIKLESCTAPRMVNIISRDGDYTSNNYLPTYGIWLTQRSDHLEWTNTCVVMLACAIRGAKSHCFYLDAAINLAILGGYAEHAGIGGSGYGLYVGAGVSSLKINTFDIEACDHGGADIESNNGVIDCLTMYDATSTIVVGGSGNQFNGGATQAQLTINGSRNDFHEFGMLLEYPPIDNGSFNSWRNQNFAKASDLVPVRRHPNFSTGSATAYPGETFVYYGSGSGGHTITLYTTVAAWSKQDLLFVNASAFPVTIAPPAGLYIAGSSAAGSKVVPPYARARIWYDDSYFWMSLSTGLGTGQIALTDAATINTDASQGGLFSVTLGGNRTMAAPTNLVPGQVITYRIKQDATGSRTLTWNSIFAFSGGSAPTLTATANKIDRISFIYDANDNKLYHMSTTLNL